MELCHKNRLTSIRSHLAAIRLKLHVQQLRCYAELHQICFASPKFHKRQSPGISLLVASCRSPTSSVWIGIAKVAITYQLRLHKSDMSPSNFQATIASHQFRRTASPITDQHHRLCYRWPDSALLAIVADSTIAFADSSFSPTPTTAGGPPPP